MKAAVKERDRLEAEQWISERKKEQSKSK